MFDKLAEGNTTKLKSLGTYLSWKYYLIIVEMIIINEINFQIFHENLKLGIFM